MKFKIGDRVRIVECVTGTHSGTGKILKRPGGLYWVDYKNTGKLIECCTAREVGFPRGRKPGSTNKPKETCAPMVTMQGLWCSNHHRFGCEGLDLYRRILSKANSAGTKEELVNQRLDRIEQQLDKLLNSRLIWEK